MPQTTYSFPFLQDTDAVLSPEELKEIYFYGIPLIDDSGNTLPNDTLTMYIQAAQQEIERHLEIKLKRQVYEESKDYNMVNFLKWGYLDCTFPVLAPISMEGFLGDTKQVEYPTEWMTIKKSSDENYVQRSIHTVPTSGSVTYSTSLFFGIHRRVGYDSRHVPQYWRIKYLTGFEKLPRDILNIVGKLASINVFSLLGDIILGAGIASQSIGIDGLSQSIQTTQSAENAGYSARIRQYLQDVKVSLPRLEAQYKGVQAAFM